MLVEAHETQLATELSSTLWITNRGAIVERGAPRDVLERPEKHGRAARVVPALRERLKPTYPSTLARRILSAYRRV